jgi:hypothetical protein
MSSDAFVVPPLSRKDIRNYADDIRTHLKITSPYFPIVEVVEFALPKVIKGFYLDVCDEAEMTERFGRGCHGMTFPDENVMHIREDVYNRARRDEGRDRLTIAHEVAHLLLHSGLRFARRASPNTPLYATSEWQANAFGGELLMSYRHVQNCTSVSEAAALFKISISAAEVQWEAFKRDKIIN